MLLEFTHPLFTTLLTWGLSGLIIVVLLVLYQRSLQYHVRKNSPLHTQIAQTTIPIHYTSLDGFLQTSYLLEPSSKSPSCDIFIYLHGKSGLALDFVPMARLLDAPNLYHFAIEYPGFCNNKGRLSELHNLYAIQRGIEALLTHIRPKKYQLHFVGHSLGCALAIEACRMHPKSQSLTLIGGFYNGIAAGERIIGPLAAHMLADFLWDTYDNITHLKKLYQENPKISVHLLHGEQDTIVPFSDAQKLHKNLEPWTTLHSYPTLDHHLVLFCNDIVAKILARRIYQHKEDVQPSEPHHGVSRQIQDVS